MCCFSPIAAPVGLFARLFARTPAVHVADTNIFARMLDSTTQALVYAMELGAAGEVAMILPVPTVPRAGVDALEFVSFEEHPRFFSMLSELFVMPMPQAQRSAGGLSFQLLALPTLEVHRVGAFEASFVPTLKDFDRLDPRFRLPENVWREIGGYDDWGFAVFRLAPGRKARIHPMAFRFRTRDPSRLFFPTVHVHDGRVHAEAPFDHSLYFQGESSERDAQSFLTVPREAHPFVAQGEHVFRRTLRGQLPNRDTSIALSAPASGPTRS